MAGNAAGNLCLQVPGRVHLTIISYGLRANRASLATPPRVSIAAVCRAERKDLLSPEPCVWFPGWPRRKCLSCRDSHGRASRESLLRRHRPRQGLPPWHAGYIFKDIGRHYLPFRIMSRVLRASGARA